MDVWTTDHGLPQNSVNAIAQTPDGYLWVGTSGGLARFDGMRFTFVERRDSAGAHLDRIVALAVAQDGALWIATENGLLRYREGHFSVWREPHGLPGILVSGVHVDSDGTVWLIAGGQLARFANGVFTSVGSRTGHWSIARDALGVLWYALHPHGGRLDRDNVTLPAGARSFLRQDGEHRWFGTPDGGLLRVGDVSRRWSGARLGVAGLVALARDGAGDYWIASTSGLNLFHPDGGQELTWRVPLPEHAGGYDVRTLFVDAEGTLWAGTNGHGLLRVTRRRIRVYTRRDGLGKDQMTAVMEDRSGRMILGTNCGGLYELPPGSHTVRPFAWPGGERAPDCPMSLAESSDGALWVGAYGPLYRIRNGRAEMVRAPEGDAISTVHSLHETRDGTMWAGRLGTGVVAVRRDGSRRAYRRADGLTNEVVLFVTEDRDGVVWIGTPGGLGRLAQGSDRFTWYGVEDGLPSEFVRVVHQDAEGVHWIGTYGGGLARLKDGKFVTIGEREGLADNVVSSIIEDDAGDFWMTGNRGIHRAGRADLMAFADGKLPRVRGVLYDRTDGLLNVETNGGFQPAAWRARDGSMWFPTVRGVARVAPDRAGSHGRPPRAAIEEILVEGAPVTNGTERIGPGARNVELRYTGLSFVAPQHIVFRYRLVGFDNAWNVAATRRSAHYPRLPHGRYTFQVQAANRDGRWGEAAVLPIRVLPLFWETIWFRLLVTLVLVGAAAAAIRQRLIRMRRERDRQLAFARRFIDGQETERKRIAAELHDSIGQGLLVARNRAVLALGSPALSDEARAHLDEIATVTANTLEEARQISHNLRPHELDRLGLAVAIRSAAAHASGTATRVIADVSELDGLLDPVAEINVYRIVQEALNNVMKHARASNARVSLQVADGAVQLVISDNGAGFVASDRSFGFGLSGIAQRVKLVGGRYEVHSAPGSGTTIAVTIPVSRPTETRLDTAGTAP